jgi:hypothetical protein
MDQTPRSFFEMYGPLIIIYLGMPFIVVIFTRLRKTKLINQTSIKKSEALEPPLNKREFIDKTLMLEDQSWERLRPIYESTNDTITSFEIDSKKQPSKEDLDLINESGLVDFFWQLRCNLVKDTLDCDPMPEDCYKDVLSEIETTGDHDESVVVKFKFKEVRFNLIVNKVQQQDCNRWEDKMSLHENGQVVISMSSLLEQKWNKEVCIHVLKIHSCEVDFIRFEGDWNRMLIECNESSERWLNQTFE